MPVSFWGRLAPRRIAVAGGFLAALGGSAFVAQQRGPSAPGPAVTDTLREDALAAWTAGLRAAAPEDAVGRALAKRPDACGDGGPEMMVAVGKAAAGMLRGAARSTGLPAVRSFVLLPSEADAGELPAGVRLLRGGHPFPTVEGAEATRRILEAAASLQRGERLLLLLSGGASSLLEAPVEGLSFEDLAASHRALVGSGLPIASINLVRGCLSAVKAGGLASLAAPADITTLAISDVQGDDPAVIGSGPTVKPAEGRPARCRRALALLDAASVRLPAAARRHLEARAEEHDPGGAGPTGSGDYEVVASISAAVAAARAELAARGYSLAPDTGYLAGDTESAATRILAESGCGQGRRAAVFGGETTVALPPGATGRGGRNLDLAARLALAVAGRGDLAVAAAGTDGIDGSSRAAGAVVDGGSADRAAAAGLPLDAALAAFDTEPALAASGDLVRTGPTGTNVGDLVVVALG